MNCNHAEPFTYHNGQLHVEQVALTAIAAEFDTPCYVYSRAAIEQQWLAFDSALAGQPRLICFAVKANSNLAVLNLLARLGAGFDIVSVGELERVLAAGGNPQRIVFSGVGKREDELRRALEVGIRCFNVESAAELDQLAAVAARCGKIAPIALRVNPDVDAGTHPYIATGLAQSKFGIDIASAEQLYHHAAALPQLSVCGIDCHIGSQLMDLTPFIAALTRVLLLVDRLSAAGIALRHLDFGGGLGVCYTTEHPPTPAEYVAALQYQLRGRDLELMLEPGRAIVATAGALLTRVELLKSTPGHHFAVVDAAMNDLLRPALYHAVQDILPVTPRSGQPISYDIVGPVCESGDFLGKHRAFVLQAGDLLAILGSGAYGFSMSSNYNSRPRVAEVMVDGDQVHLIRRRETIADLFAHELLLP
ncbi:diaminopimelate decarboxylase [Rhodoferax sp. 4810]|uniref:Diaminopimelate decarboxylase n=1 Tax=Thiospirillum jenense TaxID=1653858 RepID=A0A839HE14_9GAMM|nr:diaminopimelate decarboxylase [Thiospirillum jenense]MBB1074185.1 diaminopimelate decarboxylase [Rhodoferax jenense]MBB1125259.1 diaminopimelate decarboxylase [Thiospirillum jenense]